MDFASLYFEAQVLVLPEKSPKLNLLPPELEAPVGMWPSQRFAVSAEFPNRLKIVEIPGLSEDAPALAGLPTYKYLSNGTRQYEFRFEDAAPDIGEAPAHFEDLKSQHGLPELLLLPFLLSPWRLDLLATIRSAGAVEYWFERLEHCGKHYCYRLKEGSNLPYRLCGYLQTGDYRLLQVVQIEFSCWNLNPNFPEDTFDRSSS